MYINIFRHRLCKILLNEKMILFFVHNIEGWNVLFSPPTDNVSWVFFLTFNLSYFYHCTCIQGKKPLIIMCTYNCYLYYRNVEPLFHLLLHFINCFEMQAQKTKTCNKHHYFKVNSCFMFCCQGNLLNQ